MKEWILKWLIPSNWVEWLKGKKRILGIVALILWFCIYPLPIMFPQLGPVAQAALTVQQFLMSLGLGLDDTLFTAGAGLTVVGLLDWILKHIVSDGLVKLLEAVQGATVKLVKARSE